MLPAIREYKNVNDEYPWYVTATLALELLPLYSIDAKDALLVSCLQTLFATSDYILSNTNPYTTLCMSEKYLFTSMFSTYRMYTTMKRLSSDNLHRQNVPFYKTSELMLAPYKPKNFLHPVNLITFGLVASGMTIVYAVSDRSNSVWNA